MYPFCMPNANMRNVNVWCVLGSGSADSEFARDVTCQNIVLNEWLILASRLTADFVFYFTLF